jgi:flagellar hook protein FlgE
MEIGSTAAAGLWANQAQFNQAADRIANVNTPPAPGANPVELTEEVPAMILAENGYTANAQLLRVQDETTHSLIDVFR